MALKYKPIRDLIEEYLETDSSIVLIMFLKSKNLQDMEKYWAIKKNLYKMLSPYFNNVKVHFYGSRVFGLATKDSDLDIYIEIDNNFYSSQDCDRDRKIIRRVEKIMRDPQISKGKWEVKICIDTAKVPLIKARYEPHDIKCDIIVTNGFGVMNSLILRHLFGLQPEAIKLFHFVKLILPQIDKKFDGYLLKILVLFFLQQEDLLPSVREVQENLREKTIDGWPVQFNSKRNLRYYQLPTLLNYQSVVPSFFNFYANVSQNVLSVYEGRVIHKNAYEYQQQICGIAPLRIFGPIDQMINAGNKFALNHCRVKIVKLKTMASKYEPIRYLVQYYLESESSIVLPLVVESKNLQGNMHKYSIKESLQRMLSPYFNNVKVHFYGSRAIGVATEDSDLDIFIEIDDNFYSSQDIDRDRKIIRHVEKIMRDPQVCKGMWEVHICIDNAKVPLIRASFEPRDIKCDIIVTNGFGVMNSLMLNYLFELQPEAIKLFHFIKLILPKIDKKFNGYLLEILVLFFLQRENLLPSIRAVQKKLPLKCIDDWQVQFNPKRDLAFYHLLAIFDYKYLIPSFFNFYGNLGTKILSLYEGRFIHITEYKYNQEISDITSFNVFGPLNQMHNVGKRVSREKLSLLRGTCSSVFNSYLEHLKLHQDFLEYLKL